MKIVLFGVGEIYKENKSKISKDDEIVAFIDNNKQLQGTKCDGIEIYSPTEISRLSYDKIVIMSAHFMEMKSQLLRIGCKREHIIYYIEYVSQQVSGRLSVYYRGDIKISERKCLIITGRLNYTGGAMVAVYAALALQDRGYDIVVAAAEGDKKFIDEFCKKGIMFVVYPNLQFAKWGELFWVKDFHTIIVNTYPMVLAAIEISKHRKVIFWLHENDIVYPSMDFWKDRVLKTISAPNLMMYAVSHVARKNFFNNVMKCEIGLLPYGIPDIDHDIIKFSGRLTFAVIGTIHPIKQQLLFLDAVRQMNILYQDCDYLIIGRGNDTRYEHMVETEAENMPNVNITGELTRGELEALYDKIDIVVVPSSQESMSLTATEAMMYGKVCILSDIAGMAQYVKQGENGLVFKSGDVGDLVKQMSYCVDNKGILQKLGKNARETYNQYFTLGALGNRLEDVLRWQE